MNAPEEYPEPQQAAAELKEVEAFDSLFVDPVIEAYKKDVDVTLLERTLRLPVAERAQQLVNATSFLRKFRPIVAKVDGGE
jgi:hypothetical protein